MRLLSASLLVAVLVSLIGIGLVLNGIYGRLVAAKAEQSSGVYEAMLEHYSELLDQHAVAANELPPELDASVFALAEMPLPDPLQAEFLAGKTLDLASEHGVFSYRYLPLREAVLRLRSPEPAPQSVGLNVVFTVLFYLAVVLAIGLWLLPLIASLQRLRLMSRRVGQGVLAARVKSAKISYIRDIEFAFNDMAAKIERLLEDNRLLGRAVSHELKTPLARLRLGVDVIAETLPANSQQYIDRIDHDLDEMQSLIDVLLQYSRLESAVQSLQPEALELVSFCQQRVKAFAGYDCQMSLSTAVDTVTIHTDPAHFAIVLTNLLNNAVHYGGGQVLVTVVTHGKQVLLTVEDNGAGIPAAQREAIFMPFKRLEDTKAKDYHGHGVGLAVVRRLAQILGIEVAVDQSPRLGGARFTLAITL